MAASETPRTRSRRSRGGLTRVAFGDAPSSAPARSPKAGAVKKRGAAKRAASARKAAAALADAGMTPGRALRPKTRRSTKEVERTLPEENIFSPPPAPKVRTAVTNGAAGDGAAWTHGRATHAHPTQVAARPVFSPVTPGKPTSPKESTKAAPSASAPASSAFPLGRFLRPFWRAVGFGA